MSSRTFFIIVSNVSEVAVKKKKKKTLVYSCWNNVHENCLKSLCKKYFDNAPGEPQKMLMPFDPTIPLLGTRSQEIIQKKKRG